MLLLLSTREIGSNTGEYSSKYKVKKKDEKRLRCSTINKIISIIIIDNKRKKSSKKSRISIENILLK